MIVTIPRSTLIVAGLFCFVSGMCVGNAFAAHDAGYSPLGAAAGAVLSFGLVIHLVWAAARPRPSGPVPRRGRPPEA